jgi:carboxymethylenebutenolidase
MTGSRYSLSESIHIEVPATTPMPAYVARPDGAESRGSVIVGMELFDITAHVRGICDRLAARGYAAIAPDFYHRTAPGIELPADDHGRERGFELLQQLTRTHALDDLAATIKWIATNRAPLAGMVGLSVGGHLAYLAATQFKLPAVSIFYGGWIPTTDIPLSQPEPTIAATTQISGRVQMFVGSKDPIVPAEHRRQITDALTTADIDHQLIEYPGVDHQLIEYPGVGHGFLCDRRASFHPEAANDAWNRLLRFLERS